MARPPRALSVDFEWDAKKAIANAQRHGVTFDEASQVFADDHSSTVADPDHSAEEERSLLFGVTKGARALVVSFTDRGDRIRIINARPMTPNERRAYEQ
jgi:uncharacterized DUF497 family protein